MVKRVLLYSFLLAIILISCRKGIYPTIPEGVRFSMDKSGINRIEFVEAITKYKDPKDSLRLQALYSLIDNMKGHGYRTYLLQDTTGAYIDYNIREYDNYHELKKSKDSIEESRGPLHFIRNYYGPDLYKITSRDMVMQVENSFFAWQHYSWSENYSFDTFCRNILPYRSNSAMFFDTTGMRAARLPVKKKDITSEDVFTVAKKIMDILESQVVFDKRFVEHPTDQLLTNTPKKMRGRTEDAAALFVNTLRSLGIAAAIDFVPYPRETGEYIDYWVVVWNAEGKKRTYHPFSGSLKIHPDPVKVFRRSYETYNTPLPDDSLFRLMKYHHLKTGMHKDVTDEYQTKTTSWKVFPHEITPLNKFKPVILAIRNDNKWLPVDWAYFTKPHLFRKLKPGESYALINAEGKVFLEKSFPEKR
ncbi:MAG: hypothetical protein K9J27_04335 [Bacteroidales bacterium]|nr:hypothetical protein [Bacteroidales bacterium]MCF8332975.1 hypothetical protein [Bacteroidales bacterium]